jgi:exosome complex component RRP42
LAALSALRNATIPNERYGFGTNERLPVDGSPISCTFVKYDNAILIDPCLEEEEVAQSRLTITTDERGDIRAMQKGLSGSFSIGEIREMIKLAKEKAREIRKILNEVG